MKLFISLVLFSLPALCAVDVALTPGDWPLYRGSTIVSRHATLEACAAAAKALNVARTYTCRTTVTVVATTVVVTPPPQPPPTETWTQCAVEDALCAFTGTRRVRYGADTRWVTRDMAASGGGVQCSNAVFGDPAQWTPKRCDISDAVIAAPPPPTGTATVSWVPVTLNTDGSPATITSYTIYYGRNALDQAVTVPATDRSRVIGGLTSGTWQFTVTATSANTETPESARPTSVTKVIP